MRRRSRQSNFLGARSPQNATLLVVSARLTASMSSLRVSVVGPASPLLEARGLVLTHGRRTVLSGVSMSLNAGEIVALIGPNGAGKTTLLEVLVGARRAAQGEVLGRGQPIRTLAQRGQLMSWVADDAVPTPERTVRRVLESAAETSPGGREQLQELQEPLRLAALWNVGSGRLSRGERRRVAIAEALVRGRPLVVLDEPFAAFDPLQLRDALAVIRTMAGNGTGFLVSVHQIEQALRVADRCVLLSEGTVVADGTEAQLREAAGVLDGSLEDVVIELLRQARPRDAA